MVPEPEIVFIPFPVSEIVCGLPEALSLTFSVAPRGPIADGEKVTVMRQEFPVPKPAPQLFDWPKSAALVPVKAMLLILSVAVPLFANVATSGMEVVVPTI
jgi:hypothetical protein